MMNRANVSGSVAVLRARKPHSYFDKIVEQAKALAKDVTCYAFDTPLDTVLDAEKYGIVILEGMEEFPSGLKAAVYHYLSRGGRTLLVGGPAFQKELHCVEGNWQQRSVALEEALAGVDYATAEKKAFFHAADADFIEKMKQNAYNADSETVWTVDDYGLFPGEKQLQVSVQKLKNWNTFAAPIEFSLDGANAMMLHAKANDDHTYGVGVQIVDADGEKWFARIPLTQEWTLHVIPDFEFILYKDCKSNKKKPDLSRIREVAFGFTYDWLSTESIDHTYLLSDIFACKLDIPYVAQDEAPLRIDALTPMWELYPLTNAATIGPHHNQIIVKDRDYVLPASTYSCYPHRQGMGYNNNRIRRFIPLLEVKDEKGLHSGYAAWLNLLCSRENCNKELEGSVMACFSATSEDFYDENGLAAVADTLGALMRDHFMIEGGTHDFTYILSDKPVTEVGVAHIALRGTDANAVTSAVELYEGDKLLVRYEGKGGDFGDLGGNIRGFSNTFDFSIGKPDRAVATLTLDGEIIDRIEHEIHYWEPKPVEERKYVYTEDGYFKRDGEIVNLYGVNFGPSYRAGISSNSYWLGNADYDPEIVANDLERLKDVGFNALALWGAGHIQANLGNAMVDLLRRCEEKGFYVDMALADHAYPLKNFNAERVARAIKKWHLDEIDFLISYDIAWEFRIGNYVGKWWDFQPDTMIGDFVGRKWLDADWAKWIDTQYGSLQRAQQIWGCTLEMTPEGYPYVSDNILDDQTGKYDRMLAAYYRFLDDAIAKYMEEGMQQLRALAPNQLFSFRMSMSGSGLRATLFKPATHCFDFQTMAPVLDFMSPEGYQLGTETDEALQVPVANAYARYTAPNAPVVWKEFGLSSWAGGDDANFCHDQKKRENVANTVDVVYTHMFNAYTSAVFYWWSAMGYRIDERGDCGFLNPDGTDRPVATVLRKHARPFIEQGARQRADVLIEVERENQAGAIYGIYEAAYDKAKEAFLQGKTIDFVDATQKDFACMAYADEVCTASVDGVATEAPYPLRYVNGMIKKLEKDASGALRLTVCNTKQSIWRAGSVSVVSTPDSEVAVNAVINEDVGYLQNVTLTATAKGNGKVKLRLRIAGTDFGPCFEAEL